MKKKVGRPTELKKDSLIKVRVDSETLKSIDKVLEDVNQNRSEVIREMLPIISSRDFENMISLSSLKRLEQYSIECNNFFDKEDLKIKLNHVSEKFPAFVSESPDPILYIKYPTYKVRILSLSISQDEISKVLGCIDGISSIYETRCALFDPSNPTDFNIKYLYEIMCLKDNLAENENIKDYVCSKLKDKNIKYEVWPGYYIKGKMIEITSIDGEKYITKKSMS
ncbi:ribbon-helix-helix domain-containing protein [Paraclostridium sordellii]|uniref:ribbon-helix-helix domain-containing protein n=1 Tax=Paraclostridium sordellii TaxID=1505 RepID=UPI000E49BBED|nr:ribbon-helix-helix domain-containing protein [Paeniclostridium sordellii]RGX02691.1 CopG family transcriptional regulator [Paeniclostridium sordellii]